jgi:heme/copper-type cytochrome/quinol oxidase subunit 3
MSDMTVDHHHHVSEAEKARSIDNQKFAMWLFLASETVIFTTIIAAYIIFRIDNPEIVKEVHERLGLSGILIVTFNSFILLTSSWAMVMGLRQIQKGNRQGLIRWFWFVTVLGIAFLGLQYYEYMRLAEEGIALNYNPDSEFGGFGMRFYAPTAFHGAHVIVGVLWALFVIRRAQQGAYDDNPVGVEIFGLYWHFVDVVWVFLFTFIYLI